MRSVHTEPNAATPALADGQTGVTITVERTVHRSAAVAGRYRLTRDEAGPLGATTLQRLAIVAQAGRTIVASPFRSRLLFQDDARVLPGFVEGHYRVDLLAVFDPEALEPGGWLVFAVLGPHASLVVAVDVPDRQVNASAR